MNAKIVVKVFRKKKYDEPVGNILIKSSKLKTINCPREIVTTLAWLKQLKIKLHLQRPLVI